MTLYELGMQYYANYEMLIGRVSELKRQLDKLSNNDLIYMQRRIASLYNDALYCKKIYDKLTRYYK